MQELPEILVAEDDEDILFLLEDCFTEAGFRVILARSGDEALSIFNTNPNLGVIVSDFKMPGIDGLSLLKKIRATHYFRPSFIFITGFNDISVEDALDAGAEALFVKPFDERLLVELVKKLTTIKPDHAPRQSHRTTYVTRVDLVMGDQVLAARSSNIGRGGMFIGTATDGLRIGDSIKFSFELKSGDSEPSIISGDGIIRWIRPHGDSNLPEGIGFEFAWIRSPGKEMLGRLINELMTCAYIPKQ